MAETQRIEPSETEENRNLQVEQVNPNGNRDNTPQ